MVLDVLGEVMFFFEFGGLVSSSELSVPAKCMPWSAYSNTGRGVFKKSQAKKLQGTLEPSERGNPNVC